MTISEAVHRMRVAEVEVERLRKLCAEASMHWKQYALHRGEWKIIERLDAAAGRGEG